MARQGCRRGRPRYRTVAVPAPPRRTGAPPVRRAEFEGTYLFRVLNGAAYDWIEKAAARREREVLGGDTYDVYATTLAGGESPGAVIHHRERLAVLLAALRHLGPVDRAIVCQRLSGHPPTVIAYASGLSVTAVQHRIYRAIPRLRDLIAFAAQKGGDSGRVEPTNGIGGQTRAPSTKVFERSRR
jgi:hypothetical protein